MKKDNIILLVIVTILVGSLCFAIGLSMSVHRAEHKFLKQALITPPAEWTERYGDSLRARQVWNIAAMANDLKILQAEQKKIVK